MKFTSEMLKKAKTAKTAEELLEMAKEAGVEMTAEEATKYFSDLGCEGELADEELDNVAGGCDTGYESKDAALASAKYKIGDKVTYTGVRMTGAKYTDYYNVLNVEARYESSEWWVYYYLMEIGSSSKKCKWMYEGDLD